MGGCGRDAAQMIELGAWREAARFWVSAWGCRCLKAARTRGRGLGRGPGAVTLEAPATADGVVLTMRLRFCTTCGLDRDSISCTPMAA